MNYKNPIPVVVGLFRVYNEDAVSVLASEDLTVKLLAIKRSIEPFIGGLAFPGGYINEGESAEIAVAREILEETGIETKAEHWRPLKTMVTPTNRLLIFMRHIAAISEQDWEQAKNNFKQNDEVSEILLVDAVEEDLLCFPLHQEILQRKLLWE